MRSVKELIEEIRFNTNRVNKNRFTDESLIRYLNTAQRQIQRIVFLSNPKSQHFTRDYTFAYSNLEEEYTLPSWAYVQNSIHAVFPVSNGTDLKPLQTMDERERRQKSGYFVKKNKIIIPKDCLGASVDQIRVVLWEKIPDLVSVNDVPDVPDACEDLLTIFVERKINYTDSSKDIANSSVFTNEEIGEISKLFSNTSKDVKYPVILDTSYMT